MVSGDDPPARDGAGVTDAPVGEAESESRWEERWYLNGAAIAAVTVDFVAVLVVVVGTTGVLGQVYDYLGIQAGNLGVKVPWFVYAYAALGAFGYVFTTIIREFDREAGKVLQATLRVPAALPLAAGLYLLSAQVVGSSAPDKLLGGLAFIAGLYVNLTYERIGALADRLLPGEDGDTGDSESGDPDAADIDAPRRSGPDPGSSERQDV